MKTKIILNIILWTLTVLTCFAWIAFTFIQPVGYTMTFLVILILMTVVLSWCLATPYIKTKDRTKRLDENFKLLMLSVAVVPLLMFLLSYGFVWCFKTLEKKQFNHDHIAAMVPGSNFNQLQKFAKENYNAPLVLGDFNESWALTSLDIPQASPASLRSSTGYCLVNMSKTSMNTMYKEAKTDVSYNDWEMLILAHELSHCLDRATDVPGELGQPLKALNSIAPSDRSKVKMDDVSTFVTAESSGKTQLWRESYADLFAVGFMSLDPKYDTAALRESLIKLREKRKAQDPTHNSVCWLQYSKSQPFPQKGSDVYSWANNIRIKAACELK